MLNADRTGPPTEPVVQNLVELYVLSSLGRLHSVPLKNVLRAIAYLRDSAETGIHSTTASFSPTVRTCWSNRRASTSTSTEPGNSK